MLQKILAILAIVATLGASALAYLNHNTKVQTRIDKAKINKRIKDVLMKDIVAEVAKNTDTLGTLKDTEGVIEQKKVELDGATNNLKSKTNDLEKLVKDIADNTEEVSKLEAKVKELLGDSTPDMLQATLETLNKEITDRKTEMETTTKEKEVADKAVAQNTTVLKGFEDRRETRKKGIALNSTEGTVLASNPDYAFVVIDIGENKGVTADSKLIVMRSGQRVGLLNITSIEKTRTVADVIADSLSEGGQVQPGDKVIFEKTTR